MSTTCCFRMKESKESYQYKYLIAYNPHKLHEIGGHQHRSPIHDTSRKPPHKRLLTPLRREGPYRTCPPSTPPLCHPFLQSRLRLARLSRERRTRCPRRKNLTTPTISKIFSHKIQIPRYDTTKSLLPHIAASLAHKKKLPKQNK